MSIGYRIITGRIVRPSFATVLATVLALAAVAPALAVSGPTRLSDPSVSPRSASPSDLVAFAVTYRNREGSPPDEVRVVIDGTAHLMTYDVGDEAWKGGVRFTFSTTLPVGTHSVVFSGIDRERFTDEIDGGTVTVALPPTPAPTPAPAPDPTPAPTAAPSAAPTAAPSAAPTAAPTPTPARAVPAPTRSAPMTGGGASPGDPSRNAATPGPDGSATEGIDDLLPPRPDDVSADGADAGSGGSGPDSPTDPDGSSADPDGAGPDAGGEGAGGDSAAAPPAPGGADGLPVGGWGDFARALQALGVDADRSVLVQVLPTLVSTTGGVALAMAFMFFGKKRRDGDPPAPDEVLHASAARGTELPTAAALVPGPGPAAPVDLEASMPRWRRPSLLQARKADPLRDAAPARVSLSFEHGLVGPIDGCERRVIRYRVVRLLDAPDELRSAEIGFLDQGDEVQLLERSGTYWLVLCPDGRRGWLHRMTLGDVVGEQPAPGPLETWATDSIGGGIDDDVLTAFLAARGRA